MPGRRPNPSIKDMLLAVGILLVPLWIIMAVFTRPAETPVTPITWQPVAAAAKAAAPFPVWAPATVPADWVATRARWTPIGQPGVDQKPVPGNTWQLGFLTGQRVYLALDQTDKGIDALIDKATRQGREDGSSTLDGRLWLRTVSADGRTRALVLRERASTVVVSGDVPYADLELFVGLLRRG